MTKIYTEKKEMVITKTLERTICDWCKEEIPKGKNCNDNNPDVETEIRQSIKHYCYESGTGNYWEINDLCVSCGEKLKTHLIELGITIIENEIDW